MFSSSAELATAADLVIRGVAVGSRTEKKTMEQSAGNDEATNPPAGLSEAEKAQALEDSYVVTISTVRVEEVFKGSVSVGDTIEVSQLAGCRTASLIRKRTPPLLQADKGYLLFLAAHGAGVPYDLPNPQQAMYAVAADGTLTPADGGADMMHIENLQDAKTTVESTD